MTPLAFYLAKQLLALKREREHIWVEDQNRKLLRDALTDIHCFETTDCWPLIEEMCDMFRADIDTGNTSRSEALYEGYSFLPAPKTWIEWRHGSGNRIGTLVEEGAWHRVTFFCKEFASHLGSISATSGDYYDGTPGDSTPRYLPTFLTDRGGKQSGAAILSAVHTMLVLINSPRIIGRRQHMPHAGLERRLLKSFQPGKFPLHAWTEIKLEVAKPVEIDDGEMHEAHLTGRRALHFVRKHIRIRLGKLEYVSAHWRGDPAIGIKQSRYKVVA